MKAKKILPILSKGFILLSALSLLSISIMAFSDPQSVMDLVNVKLDNTDAYSSIRGIYGGAGLTIVISLIYFMWKEYQKGLVFLTLFWGLYALSRIITIGKDGALGDFGTQWLFIESIFFAISLSLFVLSKKLVPGKPN
jgi:hypothetical protein